MSFYDGSSASYSVADVQKKFLSKVFGNMALGLLVTTLVAFLGFASFMNGGIFYALWNSSAYVWIVLGLTIAELAIAFALPATIQRSNPGVTRALFYGYSALTGIEFSVLFLAFDISTIFAAFLAAAVMFVCCAVIGRYSSFDFMKLRGVILGGLIALIVITLLGMFIPAIGNSLWISYIGVILFAILTCYDIQVSGKLGYAVGAEGDTAEKYAVYQAFGLYLDFINIFLYLLRIFGSTSSSDN